MDHNQGWAWESPTSPTDFQFETGPFRNGSFGDIFGSFLESREPPENFHVVSKNEKIWSRQKLNCLKIFSDNLNMKIFFNPAEKYLTSNYLFGLSFHEFFFVVENELGMKSGWALIRG